MITASHNENGWTGIKMGAGLKPEIADLREEIGYLRILLEDMSRQLAELSGRGKRSA